MKGFPVSPSDLIPMGDFFFNATCVRGSLKLAGKYHPEHYKALTN